MQLRAWFNECVSRCDRVNVSWSEAARNGVSPGIRVSVWFFLTIGWRSVNTEQQILSPCVGVCQLAADSSVCLGCYRTPEEIGAWPGLDDAGRHTIMQDAELRLVAAFDEC